MKAGVGLVVIPEIDDACPLIIVAPKNTCLDLLQVPIGLRYGEILEQERPSGKLHSAGKLLSARFEMSMRAPVGSWICRSFSKPLLQNAHVGVYATACEIQLPQPIRELGQREYRVHLRHIRWIV